MSQHKSKQTAPPPLPQPEDAVDQAIAAPVDRVAEFLQRAGGIISLERGINVRSRVKLAAVADELGLSEDELDQAMAQLLGGDRRKKKPSREEQRDLRRRKRAFHNLVGETLAALPQHVLTASMEHMLVIAGTEEHGLSKEEAQAEVLDLAGKLRVRRITEDEAIRHITELASAKMGPAGILSRDVRARICAEASRWGLTPDQVEPIFKGCVSKVRRGEQREQYRTVALVSASAAVLMAVLGMLGWMAFSRSLPGSHTTPPVAEEAGPKVVEGAVTPPKDDTGTETTSTTPDRFGVPKWWDESFSSYVANARLRLPAMQDDLYQLRSPQETDRQAAYGGLMERARTDNLGEEGLAILSGLFAAAYAIEPSDECATQLRARLMETAAGPGDKLPENADAYRHALWASETAVAALIHERLSPERSTGLLAALERTLHAGLDGGLPPARLQRQIMSAAAEHLYKSLTRAAKQNIHLAVELQEELLGQTRAYFNTATLERLATDYLVVVLPRLGEQWLQYEGLIRRCAQSEDPLNVLKMVDVLERTTAAGLQEFLATQLLLRAGIRTPPGSVAELASAVREALGAAEVTRPRDDRERAEQWQRLVDEQLSKPAPSAADPIGLLQQTIELARLSTLASALAQGELAAAEYDDLWDIEAPQIKGGSSGSSSSGGAAPRLHSNQLRNLDKLISSLRNHRRMNASTRLSHVRNIASYVSTVTDVQPDQGQDLAAYLAAAKPVDEHERLMRLVDGVLRWKMVRLGLADQLAESRLRSEHMQQLLEAALHHEVDISDDAWRDKLRDELLAGVARQLATEASLARADEGPYDRAAKALVDYYRTQARLAGVGAAEYQEAQSPAALVRLLIEQRAARLSATAATPAARNLAERAAHEIAALEYLAENDLSRTVALERLLVQLQAAELVNRDAGRRTQVEEMLAQRQQADRTAEHVLDQLYQNQKATLQLWRLSL